ncbi:MAG: ribosomal protein S18-alanine N-acetyltransferase [Betaproteobacteria bacterium]|nr:ribosomal protein S18-alanine N-acetyltransferase [Betaproteobacteria bacterium]
MNSSDIPAVLALEQRIYAFPWTFGNFADALTAGYSAWLMRAGEYLLGYAVMMLVLDEAHLLNIGIVPERQRAGLGGVLLEHLFALARNQGVARVYLEVRQSNVSARGFYLRHGFVQIGARTDYYPAQNGREAALVFERSL